MGDPNLFVVCGIAFMAVMGLLTSLAVVMRIITAVFPVVRATSDPAVIAAIHVAVATVVPDARVVKLEEM